MARLPILRTEWVPFASQTLANALGTLIAVSVIYLVGVTSGAIERVSLLEVVSLIVAVLAGGTAALAATRTRRLRQQIRNLLGQEPEAVAERIRTDELGEELATDERPDAVARAIESLPESERAILKLLYFEGLSVGEVADALHITEQTVRFVLARAIRRLSVLLARNAD